MIPLRIKIDGFRSYINPVEISLEGIGLASITGHNGAGKSTIVEAMLFALFGKVRTNKLEQAVSNGRQSATVELDFREGADRWRIVAGIDKGSRRIRVFRLDTMEEIPLSGIREADAFIEGIVGISHDHFILSSIVEQGDSSRFFRMKPVERLEFLGKVLGLDRFERLSQLAKENKSVAKARMDILAEQDRRLADRISQFGDIPELEPLEREKKLIDRDMESIEKGIKRARTGSERLSGLKGELEQLKRSITDAEDERERRDDNHRDLLARHRQLIESTELEPDIEKLRTEYDHAKNMETMLRKKSNRDAALVREIDHLEEAIRHKKQSARQRIESLAERISERDKSLEAIEERFREKASIEESLTELSRLKKRLKIIEDKRREIATMKEERAALTARIETEKRERQKKLESLRQEKTKLENEIAESEKSIEWLTKCQTEKKGLEHIDQEINLLSQEKARLEVRRSGIYERIEEERLLEMKWKERKSEILADKQGDCPLCGTALNRERLRNIVKEYTDRENKARNNRTLLSAETREVNDRLRDIEIHISELEQRRGDTDDIDKQVELCKRELAEADIKKEQIKQIQMQQRELEANPEDPRLVAQLERFSSIETDEVEREYEKVSDSIEALTTLGGRLKELQRLEKEAEQIAQAKASLETELSEIDTALQKGNIAREEMQQLKGLIEERTDLGFDEQEYHLWQQRWEKAMDIPRQIESHAASMKELSVLKKNILESQKALKAIDEKQEERQLRLDRILEEMDELSSVSDSLSILETQAKELADKGHQLGAKIEEIARKEAERERLLDEQGQNARDLKAAEREYRLSDQLRSIAGKRGVQAYVISRALPYVEEQARRILSILMPGTEIEIALSGNTSLNLDIVKDGRKRPYESLSGGERFRRDFAIRVGISRLIARRHGRGLSTLIIDEGFGTQDKEGIDLFAQSLKLVSSEFELILVITHLEALKEEFPANINLQKDAEKGTQITIEQY